MTLDTITALAIRTLQTTQWSTNAGFSTITKNLAVAIWPELKTHLIQKYVPLAMTKYVNPLARKTVLPMAQKMGIKVVRKYGIPLAKKTGKFIWVKVGYPTARKILPGFFDSAFFSAISAPSLPNMAATPQVSATLPKSASGLLKIVSGFRRKKSTPRKSTTSDTQHATSGSHQEPLKYTQPDELQPDELRADGLQADGLQPYSPQVTPAILSETSSGTAGSPLGTSAFPLVTTDSSPRMSDISHEAPGIPLLTGSHADPGSLSDSQKAANPKFNQTRLGRHLGNGFLTKRFNK